MLGENTRVSTIEYQIVYSQYDYISLINDSTKVTEI